MTRTFEALGFDPAPGDSGLTSSTATTARTIASALEQVKTVLDGDGAEPWHGRTAEAFRSTMGEELTPRVKEAAESFGIAARALTRWADALPGFQSRAEALELEAQEARDELNSAQGNLDSLPEDDAESGDSESGDTEDDRTNAQNRVSTAQGTLASVISRAEGLQTEVNSMATETANSLNSAASVAPDKPGFWDSVGDFFEGMVDWFFEEFVPIFEALAPWIGLALAIAASWIPGLGQIALGLAIAAIAIDVGQAVRGEGSWGDVAVGVAGLAGGMALGKVLKGFDAIRNSAFKINFPTPTALPGGAMGMVNVTVATIKFNPTVYNIGTFGWAATKFTDLYQGLPIKPKFPILDDDE